jgi:hypothetical protein
MVDSVGAHLAAATTLADFEVSQQTYAELYQPRSQPVAHGMLHVYRCNWCLVMCGFPGDYVYSEGMVQEPQACAGAKGEAREPEFK